MRSNRDVAIHALYDASAALDRARMVTTDPIQLARIRHLAHDVLTLIGEVATTKIETVVS